MKKAITIFVFVFFPLVSIGGEVTPSKNQQPPVSRTSGKIAKGTDWETEYFVIDSGVKGATVLITGGVHGNEPAGARAAEQILHWPITRGKLIVVPRANVLGLEADTRFIPGQPKKARDLNRNFPHVKQGGGKKVTPRGELAAALWRFAVEVRPKWVIDLHEGFEFNRSHTPPKGKTKSVGSSVIYRGGGTMDSLAERIAAAADATVNNPARHFSLLRSGPVRAGLAGACIEALGAEAVILETTFKDQPLSLRTRQHRAMVNVLLNHIGVINRDCRDFLADRNATGTVQVAMFDGKGTGKSRRKLSEVIEAAPKMAFYHIGVYEMQPKILAQFDAVLFPGGSGSKQAAAIGRSGRDAVREYVENGGGVVGVCAGAYLCSAHYSWSLGLIDAAVFTGSVDIPGKGEKQLWYRGKEAGVDVELSPKGEKLFADCAIPKRFVVRYANGPIIAPKKLDSLEDYEVLAWFRSEVVLWKAQKGTMINTPAIVSGSFGRGRVISISPHPERTPSFHPIITRSIRWVTAAGE